MDVASTYTLAALRHPAMLEFRKAVSHSDRTSSNASYQGFFALAAQLIALLIVKLAVLFGHSSAGVVFRSSQISQLTEDIL